MKLQQLEIRSSTVRGKELKRIVQTLPNTSITQFGYSPSYRNDWDVGFVETLGDILAKTSLTTLDLCGKIKINDARHFIERLPGTSIRHLVISTGSFGDIELGSDLATALKPVIPQTLLTVLNLSGQKIGANGAKALAQALPTSCIVTLCLANNAIADEGMAD